MNMSSRRYINAASEYLYTCTLICYTFRSAAFYKDPPLVIHALAQELSPQEIQELVITARVQLTILRILAL